jgi:hypothetical protein
MAGRQDYEERKQARIERLESAADKARSGSQAAAERSYNLTKDIPLGQPNINGALTGVMNKSRSAIAKSCELSDKAEYLESKLKAAESNTAISSDDPDCVEKLEEKVRTLKAEQEYAKALNAYYRKNGTCKGFRDLTDEQAAKRDMDIKNSYSFAQQPYPSYSLTNLNAKIKAAQTRIDAIKRVEAMPEEIIKYGDFCEIESNAETNRITILFYNRADDELVEKLKCNGFKWAYTEGKWQRLRTPYALRIAKQIISNFVGKD